jgi:putative spermidine/putrescine transport system ATP-binding protein
MTTDLTVSGLSRHFPGAPAPAIADLDLAVEPGTCVAIVGPSGCGKSSLLRIIAGLDTADHGQIALDGQRVDDVVPERRGVALAFQQPRLFPHMSVLDNVAFPLEAHGLSRAASRREASTYLEVVGMQALAKRRPATLSGGQEQRVALARALAARPRLLLLDEPFSALDPATRTEMQALLRRVREAINITVVLVTHDRDEAGAVGDRVGVMLAGRIAQIDALEDLYYRPRSLEIHRFLGGVNEIPGTVTASTHASSLGALAVAEPYAAAQGPHVMVCRPESLSLVDADAAADVHGVVSDVSRQGMRQRVAVDASGISLSVDAGPHVDARVGDRVGVGIPLAVRHLVRASR